MTASHPPNVVSSNGESTPLLSHSNRTGPEPTMTAGLTQGRLALLALMVGMLVAQLPLSVLAEGPNETGLGGGQTTLALSKTPGLVVDGEKLLLVPQELFSTPVGEYSVVRLTKPARLVIDFPNVALNRVHRNRKYDVKRHGIETVAISEEKGPLYPSVRITMMLKQPEALAQFRIAKDGGLIAVMPPQPLSPPQSPLPAPNQPQSPSPTVMAGNPMGAISSPTTMAGMISPPRSPFVSAVPMVQPSPAMASMAVPPVTVVRKAGLIAIEDIRVGDNGLLLMGRDVGANLRLANRFQLTNPTRMVFDFANAQLASKQLAQTLTGTAKSSWRSIRIGQFDERTVRVVVETNQPKAFSLVRRGDPAVGQGVAIESANALFSSVNAQTPPTTLANVMLSKETDNGGQGQLKIQSKDPMAFQIYGEGSQVVVDLLNVPLNGPAMGFNVSSFDYIRGLTQRNLFPKAPGSSLVLELKGQSGGITHELMDGGRTLVLSFDLPKGGSVSQPPVATKPWQPPAVGYDPQNPPSPSGSLAKAPYRARVVVDAGHGGKDQGASRSGVLEKDLNLSQAKKLKEALEARGMTVLMTRNEDSFVPLPDISGFSNRNNPDLFISVHHNTSSNPSILGLETYYYQPQSIALANRIHKHMVRLVGCNDRGVRKARFYVVNHTTAPSVLIEIGYLSNPSELANVQSESRQKTAAEAIANGVVEYLNSRLSASANSVSTPAGQALLPQQSSPAPAPSSSSSSGNANAPVTTGVPVPLPGGGSSVAPSAADLQRPPTP